MEQLLSGVQEALGGRGGVGRGQEEEGQGWSGSRKKWGRALGKRMEWEQGLGLRRG